MSSAPQTVHDGGEVRRRRVAPVVGDRRRAGDHRLVGLALGVEYPQRVAIERRPALLGERVAGGEEVRPEGFDVGRPLVGLPEAVDDQLDLPEAEAAVELPRQGDDLDVELRVVDPEDLDAHLVELAVPAALGLLVAEVRPGVEHLPRGGRSMLGERAAHAGRHLGAQRDVAVALVDEVVHLLGHHVGGVTDAGEHADVLEQRGDQLAVPGGAHHVGEHGGESTPATAVGRQDVPHPGAGLERRHGRSGYRWAAPARAGVAARRRARRSSDETQIA